MSTTEHWLLILTYVSQGSAESQRHSGKLIQYANANAARMKIAMQVISSHRVCPVRGWTGLKSGISITAQSADRESGSGSGAPANACE
jgi:hypothetical protein